MLLLYQNWTRSSRNIIGLRREHFRGFPVALLCYGSNVIASPVLTLSMLARGDVPAVGPITSIKCYPSVSFSEVWCVYYLYAFR